MRLKLLMAYGAMAQSGSIVRISKSLFYHVKVLSGKKLWPQASVLASFRLIPQPASGGDAVAAAPTRGDPMIMGYQVTSIKNPIPSFNVCSCILASMHHNAPTPFGTRHCTMMSPNSPWLKNHMFFPGVFQV